MSSNDPVTGVMTHYVDQIVPPRIYWHEGMLLSQHLFQQNDLRNFQILAKKLLLVSRYNWGVITIDIDKNALSNGLFRLNEIEAIFQDGLFLQYVVNAQQGIRPLELKLNEITDNEVTIHIAVTALSNQISPLSGTNPRFYVIDGAPIADENLVGNDAVVPRLIPNAFLCLDIPEGCIGLPIAKILYESGNFSQLDFIPPCFYVPKNSLLWKRCSELIILLQDKINFSSKQSSPDNVVSPGVLTLSAVTIATLKSFLLSDDVKPCELFKELVKVLYYASAIDTFPAELLSTIPQYKHGDLNSCLLPIIDIISKYISLASGRYVPLRFNKREHFFYKYISQQDIDCAENKKFYIGISSLNSANVSDIANWVKNAVIVSDFALDKVRLKRTLGAIRHEVSPDIVTKIMPGANITLFEVEIHPSCIKAEQNLHVFNPGNNTGFQPKGIILYLPSPDSDTK